MLVCVIPKMSNYSFKKRVLGVREIKAQYLSEHLCGQTSKLSLEEEFFFSLFSLSSRHHAVCFPCLPDLEGLGESSAVCVCACARTRAHTVKFPTTTSLAYCLFMYQCVVRGPML